jgi:hypothetical protein
MAVCMLDARVWAPNSFRSYLGRTLPFVLSRELLRVVLCTNYARRSHACVNLVWIEARKPNLGPSRAIRCDRSDWRSDGIRRAVVPPTSTPSPDQLLHADKARPTAGLLWQAPAFLTMLMTRVSPHDRFSTSTMKPRQGRSCYLRITPLRFFIRARAVRLVDTAAASLSVE